MSSAQHTPETRARVGLIDVAKGVLTMAPDFPHMIKNAPAMAIRRPHTKETLGLAFEKVADAHPERPFLRFEGESLSYGECNRRVNQYAALLADSGVGVGDVVGILAKNHPMTVLSMLAAVKLGAVAGMLNYNQRDAVLEHSLGLLDAKVLIVDPDAAQALDSVSATAVPAVTHDFGQLQEKSAGLRTGNHAVTASLPASTQAFYIFTSGTTGMPKASVMSHYRWLAGMSGLAGLAVRMNHDDTMYCSLPLYHNNALTVSLASVIDSGGCLAIGRKFSASRFWDDVILNRATAFCYIGELCRYLLAQPPRDVDRRHNVRIAVGNGLRPEIWDEFHERFGIDRIVEFYGASELNLAFVNAFNVDKTAGFCPLPYKVVAYDPETGEPARNAKGRLTKVKTGEPGLLISKINARMPFDGYTDESATDKKIIRNAFKDGDEWFNSGDLVRSQGFSHIAFVDRLGDTFRWKGENVATTEVEAAVDSCDQVQQSVVYGVEVPGTDGRAGMAAAVLGDGVTELDGAALARVVSRNLPAYAVPLFVRIVDQLEQTSTFKNRKVELRQEGYENCGGDPLFVYRGGAEGYVTVDTDAAAEFAADVAAGKAPRG